MLCPPPEWSNRTRHMSSAVITIAPAATTIAPAMEFSLRADMTIATRNRWAMADVAGGVRLWRLAWALGWLDIRLRYRGSMLGPFWLTISTGVMVGALGVLYSTLFKIDVRDYLPFLALSQVLVGLPGRAGVGGLHRFHRCRGRDPIRAHAVLRVLAARADPERHRAGAQHRGHRRGVRDFPDVAARSDALMALPGLLLWVVDALALTLILGAFCARFRDIQPIVNSVMQIAFFMTPVIWKPDQLGADSIANLAFNPFFDLLEIVRGPMLGTDVAGTTWVGALVYSVGLCAVSWAFFVRARGRVTFWV